MLFPLPPSPSSVFICWCFLCWWVSSTRRNPGVPSFYPLSFYGRLPPGYGKVHTEPSLICTLPGACGLSSLRDEVQTLPGCWAHSRSLGTLPRVVPVVSAPSEMRCGHSPVDGHTPWSLGALLFAGHPTPGGVCSLSSL